MGIFWTRNYWMLYYYALYTCSSHRLSTTIALLKKRKKEKKLLLNIQRMGKSSLPEQRCEKNEVTLQDVVLFRKTHLWTVHRLHDWAKLHSEQSLRIIAWKTNISSFYTNFKRVNLKHFKFFGKLMGLKYIMIILL